MLWRTWAGEGPDSGMGLHYATACAPPGWGLFVLFLTPCVFVSSSSSRRRGGCFPAPPGRGTGLGSSAFLDLIRRLPPASGVQHAACGPRCDPTPRGHVARLSAPGEAQSLFPRALLWGIPGSPPSPHSSSMAPRRPPADPRSGHSVVGLYASEHNG